MTIPIETIPIETTPIETNTITPALLLDESVMQANIARMRSRLVDANVIARPHVKTAKSLPVIERMVAGDEAPRLTVSTLREASVVLAAGYKDVLYAVGVAPQKLSVLAALAKTHGARVSVILDSSAMAQAFVAMSGVDAAEGDCRLQAFIEIDVDNHRAGVSPERDELMAIGQILAGAQRSLPGAPTASADLLRGVMTHAGGAYDCRSGSELIEMAERERLGAVQAAERLRGAGIACDEVSVGSTPTAMTATSFEGVTEVRVGVYVFNDLVMAGLGVCKPEQIALSVLTTVIGHQPARNTLLVDAGWMALSSDRGTGSHRVDQGLGLAVPLAGGDSHSDLIVASANQEHGLIVSRTGHALDFARYPIGTQLRILPVHACATAAQFDAYQVHGSLAAGSPEQTEVWSRFGGWSA